MYLGALRYVADQGVNERLLPSRIVQPKQK
jgi:hypothetical protein